jgi:hypothetical protein
MPTRADDCRQRALAADRRAGEASDPVVRGAYDQMARDWLTPAEQIEWMEGYGNPTAKRQVYFGWVARVLARVIKKPALPPAS